MRVVFYVLFSLAALLVLLLIIGTIFGLARSSDDPVLKIGKQKADAQGAAQIWNEDTRVFSGLGRLRIPLSNSSTMVLSIAFPYPAGDVTFTEELAVKIDVFRSIAIDYLSSLSPLALENFDEEAAKKELLRRYNATLRLGRLEDLYFSDLMIIDN
jgi:flagellar basal body-associated protein FliL